MLARVWDTRPISSIFLILLLLCIDTLAFGKIHESDSSKSKKPEISVFGGNLDVDLEYRPRTEFRNGFRQLPTSNSSPAFFTSHRARLNSTYSNNGFSTHFALQDIRVWGDTDTKDASGKAQFYEIFVEQQIAPRTSIRIGRQAVILDNERIFAENDWRQAGGQHDAIRILFRDERLSMDGLVAFNQASEARYGTSYDISWDFYRSMIVHYLTYEVNDNISLMALNFADEYTDPATGNNRGYWKFTQGGRFTYKKDNIRISVAAYYQHGKIENGLQHQAFYLEPEIGIRISDKFKFEVGLQYFSGDDDLDDSKSTAFLAQYGAFHRYNGRMDYTLSTVQTNQHEGIFNPYFIQTWSLSKRSQLRIESHILAASSDVKDRVSGNSLNKIYGYENDIRFIYTPNSTTKLEIAYMSLIPTNTLLSLPMGTNGDINRIAHFAYLVTTWTPKILNIK